jgi:hypothetical protein
MMNFLTQPQVPLDPRLNAAPMVAEQPAFTVGDYAMKKRLADALRAKASAQMPGQLDPLGKSEGANGAPGEVYINWGNILSNAAQPWIKGRQEDEAAAAEGEADAVRQQAIDNIDFESLNPEQAIRLKEMGIDVSPYVKEPEDYTKQAIQYGQTADGMWAINQLKPGTFSDEAIAEKRRMEEEATKQAHMYKLAEKAAGRSVTGGSGGSGTTSGKSELTAGLLQDYGKQIVKAKEQYGSLSSTRRSLNAMDELIYGKKDKDGKRIPNSGALGLGSAALSHAASMGIPLAQYAQSSPARQLETIINEQILAKAEQLSGALSDKDLAFLERSLMSLKDSPESAAAIYEGVKSRLEGAEGRLLATRKGMVDMDERLGGFWIDPTTGEEVQEPTIGITAPKEATPIGASWTDGGDGYEYRIVDGKKYRQKKGG